VRARYLGQATAVGIDDAHSSPKACEIRGRNQPGRAATYHHDIEDWVGRGGGPVHEQTFQELDGITEQRVVVRRRHPAYRGPGMLSARASASTRASSNEQEAASHQQERLGFRDGLDVVDTQLS